MALKDSLAAIADMKPRTFKEWKATASREDVDLVMSYIHNKAIQPNTLAVTLREEGIPITYKTLMDLRAEGDR